MVRPSFLRGPGLAATLMAAIGFAASVAQLVTLGLIGIVTVTVVVVAVMFLVTKFAWPALRQNGRGQRLLNSIADLGLRDLEMRGYGRNHLPELHYLKSAQRDVLVVGPTLYGMVERHAGELASALGRGVAIRLLILDPDWVRQESLTARVDLSEQILAMLRVLRNEGLERHRGLSVRFTTFVPTYRGVLVDADVEYSGNRPSVQGGWLRLQPHLNCDLSGHQAMVAEFAATPSPESPFALFADDLRKTWKRAAERTDILPRE